MPQARCSRRFLRILLLLVLTAGPAVAPFRLGAQKSAPTAQPATVSATNKAPGTEAAKTEEAPKSEQEENNVYLHAPVVQALARMLHLDVDIAAKIFEFINFAIIVLAIGIPLFRLLPKYLRKRSEKVSADIESARKVTEDAGARLSAIEAKLAGLDGEIKLIRVQVEAESRQDLVRIQATIAEESARIVAAAEQEIGASAAQARRSLRNFAADLAIDQATKQLVLTPETDRALIAEFLGDAALTGTTGSGAKKGGLN
jgi:F-type H+-transporting ATPase subunit b